MPGKKRLPLDERIAAHYFVMDSGCWEWQGAKTRPQGGYGLMTMGGTSAVAHRVAWEVAVGPIPEGMQLDHLCRNRLCVNPDHLEPVTPAENTRRGLLPGLRRQGRGGGRQRQAACHQGHELTDDNRYNSGACKICARQRNREYKARKREESK